MATQWTASMVAALPDDGKRYEVLDGELAVTPAPSLNHQRVLMAFWRLLDPYMRASGVGEALVAPADIAFSTRRLLQPDLFVIPRMSDGSRAETFADVGRLLLAVEVLSATTARRDRGVKRRIYLEEQVDEYWIVDADAWCVERWWRGEERPEVATERLEWRPDPGVEPLVLELPALFEGALG